MWAASCTKLTVISNDFNSLNDFYFNRFSQTITALIWIPPLMMTIVSLILNNTLQFPACFSPSFTPCSQLCVDTHTHTHWVRETHTEKVRDTWHFVYHVSHPSVSLSHTLSPAGVLWNLSHDAPWETELRSLYSATVETLLFPLCVCVFSGLSFFRVSQISVTGEI